MSSSSSKSVQAGAPEAHPRDPTETTTVVEDQASETKGVTAFVRKRYQPKRRWTLLEDAKLVMHFAFHGARMWTKIGEKIGRTRDACRVRWSNYLSPGSKDSPFSSEEELYLMVAHARQCNKRTGGNEYTVDRHFLGLMARQRGGRNSIPVASMAGSPATSIFTASAVVYPSGSSFRSRMTAAGSGRDLLRNYSTYKCEACRVNLNSDVHGQRFMVDCGICTKVAEICRRLVNGGTYMASTGNVHQSPPAFPPSVNLNLTLATTVYSPQPPSSPPTSPSLPPASPPSPPPPPNFIEFLRIRSD